MLRECLASAMNYEDNSTELDGDPGAAAAAFSNASRAYLVVHREEGPQTTEVASGAEVVIGRAADATITFDDSRVSRRHALVRWADEKLTIEDLGSRNGTALNTKLLRGESAVVSAGDSIRIGGIEIVVALVSSTDGGFGVACPKTERRKLANVDDTMAGIVVADAAMARMFVFARRVALANTTVLVLGETGSGKEIVAQQLHAWSRRARQPFIRVNCATLQESIAESELFGHERGAFTGAEKRKAGLVEAAEGGTLFLDEVGELSLPVQAKLLAMLENRTILRVGSTVETPVDVRVIAATHRDLASGIASGSFREDLYYRLGVVVIRVPPLRERPSEIALLADLFAKRFGADLGWTAPKVSPESFEALRAYRWPGNIRELRNTIEHAMLITDDGVIGAEHLRQTLNSVTRGQAPAPPVPAGGVKAAVAQVERAAIEAALLAESGNRTRAARVLNVSLRSLLYKMGKYGIR